MRPLVKRQRAVAATMEWVRGKSFAFGSTDCAKLAAFHLKRLGYRVPLSKAGQYKTLKGAQAAIRRMGYETMPEAMDGLGFARIAPASALIGDVVSFPSDHPLGALGIVVGNGNMLAFHESHDLPVVMEMKAIDMAWSAPPK